MSYFSKPEAHPGIVVDFVAVGSTQIHFVAVGSTQIHQIPQVATGALGRPEPNVANKSISYEWSGRGDLNARPPAPQASERAVRKTP